MVKELSDFEKRIVDWLMENQESNLKDHFLADVSWADQIALINEYETIRKDAIVWFFTKRMGKRVLKILPDDIKNYVIANSL